MEGAFLGSHSLLGDHLAGRYLVCWQINLAAVNDVVDSRLFCRYGVGGSAFRCVIMPTLSRFYFVGMGMAGSMLALLLLCRGKLAKSI